LAEQSRPRPRRRSGCMSTAWTALVLTLAVFTFSLAYVPRWNMGRIGLGCVDVIAARTGDGFEFSVDIYDGQRSTWGSLRATLIGSAHRTLLSVGQVKLTRYPEQLLLEGETHSLTQWRCVLGVLPLIVVGSSLMILVLQTLRRRILIRMRISNGLCGRCGYDLRASPDRCPECGTPASGGTDKSSDDIAGLRPSSRTR
jgi:hypothetical protein